ncbi:MAG TPA: Ig-like domain-containing protein [Bryobacteraceae bacterium]
MKAILLGLLSCLATQATITQVQQVTTTTIPVTTANGTSVCAASCTAAVAPTGSGHILVAMFALAAQNDSVTAVTDNTGETWTHGPNCNAGSPTLNGNTTTYFNVDCWYVLNSAAGATTVTGTSVQSGGGRGMAFYEFSIGNTCFAYLDNSNSNVNITSSSTQSGVGLTLRGTSDVIVQQIYSSPLISSINGGYTEASSPFNRAAASLLTTTAGVAPAPTWTLASAGIGVTNAIAFFEVCSVSVSISPTSASLFPGQTQQFRATVVGSVTTTVTWSVSPGSVGSVSSTGLYTVPPNVVTANTDTVIATSDADNTKTASATISVGAGSAVLGTFQLSELFGASWPDQPIEFAYTQAPGAPPTGQLSSTARMVGPSGGEVAYQWVSSCSAPGANGCIAVRSSLPPGSNYTWTLVSGAPPSAAPVNPVSMATIGNNIEITNGLTGIRIPTQAANVAPYNMAPIQGIKLPNGVWTGAGASPNLLYAQSSAGGVPGNLGIALQTAMSSATGYSVQIVDQGPLKTLVTVSYTFNRPQYLIPAGTSPAVIVNNAGTGHYTFTATLYANSKSVLIDEDTDMVFSYYVPIYAQLQPDTARWRGHDALDGSGTPNPVCGYESPLTVSAAAVATPIVITTTASGTLFNGQRVQISGVLGNVTANGTWYVKTIGLPATQFALYSDSNLTVPVAGTGSYLGGGKVKPVYRGQALTPVSDAFQDLTRGVDSPAGYSCTSAQYRKLLADYPAGSHAAAWYVEMYKASGGSAAPVVGFYVGRASKQLYSATGPSLPGVYSSSSHFITNGLAAGIQVDSLVRGPDGSTVCPVALPCSGSGANDAVIHRNWGIFASTQADLLSPNQHQPIADEQNMMTGINLSRLYTYQLVYPDPPGGWQWLYLSAPTAAQLESWVQNGTSVCGTSGCYATLLNNSEGSFAGQALVALWQGNNVAAVQTALSSANNVASQLTRALSAGDNHFDAVLGYYQLGLATSPEVAVLNAILMNSNTTPTQKTLAKAELALFGSIFWDDDWFPIDNNSGESYGLANQVQQYLEYRAQSVFADSSQPFLSQQLAAAATYASNDFTNYFSSTGAAAGSTHYQSAFFEPLILNYMTPGNLGLLNLSDPKWTAYANWEMSIQTPPEPRFGNVRKGYSNGDGNTEGDVRTGMLGTALHNAGVNPTLAGNLMWAWQHSNTASQLTEDSQFVTTLAVIDPTITPVMPQLTSTNVPGYHSVERFNFGTPNETALWFINGSFYQIGGHRHYDDGQVSIYAHSAPLAIDFNANLYSPETPGRFIHNSIVYDSERVQAWNADQPALEDVSTLMQNPTNTEFAAFRNSTSSTGTFTASDGTVWSRTVRMMNFDPSYPVIYVNDSFSGASAAAGKTLTWNLMATGAVSTPAGSVTPTTRFSIGCQSPAGALPSSGTVSSLGSGLSHFNFTGATWLAHATQGINWDLYTILNNTTGQFFIGNWGHGCQSSTESGQYQAANGAGFAESQHILRVHDTGPFTTVILPYRKTEAPTRSVTQPACGTQISQTTNVGTEITCFNGSMAMYAGIRSRVLTVYDTSTQAAFGFQVSGGPQEVSVQSDQIIWTISGDAAGSRSLTLPGNWYPNPAAGLTRSGDTFSYNYTGYAGSGPQAAPVTITFSQLPLP